MYVRITTVSDLNAIFNLYDVVSIYHFKSSLFDFLAAYNYSNNVM
jgi:hypothetical protein